MLYLSNIIYYIHVTQRHTEAQRKYDKQEHRYDSLRPDENIKWYNLPYYPVQITFKFDLF